VKTSKGPRPRQDMQFGKFGTVRIKRYIFAKQFVSNCIVLDAGCGSGNGVEYLAANGAQRVIGIDISHKVIQHAKKHYLRDNLEFQMMDVTNLAFGDATFDVVVSFEVIEHIRQYHQYLSEILRVLKPGGLFIMSTPNRRFRTRQDSNLPTLQSHLKEFFTQELGELLASCFPEVRMCGMHITTPSFREEQKQMEKRLGSGLRGFLIRIVPIRLIRVVPPRLKMMLAGVGDYKTVLNVKVNSALTVDDLEINENEPDEARDLIAVCKR